jgi:hypothetical protein
MTPEQLEEGYWRAYRDFYRWSAIARGALSHADWIGRVRHFAYASGWKKSEPLWDLVLRLRSVASMRPVLESVLQPPGGSAIHSTPTAGGEALALPEAPFRLFDTSR